MQNLHQIGIRVVNKIYKKIYKTNAFEKIILTILHDFLRNLIVKEAKTS